jgi:hypothetical protein
VLVFPQRTSETPSGGGSGSFWLLMREKDDARYQDNNGDEDKEESPRFVGAYRVVEDLRVTSSAVHFGAETTGESRTNESRNPVAV